VWLGGVEGVGCGVRLEGCIMTPAASMGLTIIDTSEEENL